MLILMSVIKFRKLSGIISSNILSAFPIASHLGVHNMYVGPLDVARLCSLFFNLKKNFLRLDSFNCLTFKFTD